MLLMLPRQSHELAESATGCILFEGLALGELLEHLEAGGQFLIGLAVEGNGWLKRAWWNNFDASILVNVFVFYQRVDVDEWIRKLLLCRKIGLHLFYIRDTIVNVFGLSD